MIHRGSFIFTRFIITSTLVLCITHAALGAGVEIIEDLHKCGIAEVSLMAYCPNITLINAESVYAVYDEVSTKLFLAGVIYPQDSRESAFVIVGVNASTAAIGEGADLRRKGNNIKLHRNGLGRTLWVDETFEWNGKTLQRTEFHRTVDMDKK